MHIQASTKLHLDNTGNAIDIYTILIVVNNNVYVLENLIKYQIRHRYKSHSWHKKLIQIISMLLDYMDANYSFYGRPVDLTNSFVDAVYSGTIDDAGVDMSGLYWLPKKRENANQLLRMLNDFSDWVYQEYGKIHLNPWIKATSYEERINWLAHINKNKHSFLSHLNTSSDESMTSHNVRSVLIKDRIVSYESEKISFPEYMIFELLFDGFKKKNNCDDILEQYNWRDMLITILLIGGGIRLSEAFHIWLQDIYCDPYQDNIAIVRIYHPQEGRAPKDYNSPKNGKNITDRENYLFFKY